MFEAQLTQSSILKKIIDAIKDLVTETSWDCSSTGMSLQAMDTSHVSLVSVQLNADGFSKFRCDRGITLGMNLTSLSKVLKCAGNDDTVTVKAPDNADKITLVFEAKNETEVSEYELKLMNLDSEYLGIPDTQYSVNIQMPSHKFQRICRDLLQIGDTITISCAKDGVRFGTVGDLGSGNTKLFQTASQDNPEEKVVIKMSEPICLSFSAKNLMQFSKATPLSPQVELKLAPDVPLVVEFKIQPPSDSESDDPIGKISYYLAPKIDENDD